MKYKITLAAAAALMALAGCASVPVTSKEILEFTVKPDKGIKPGTIITAVVRTTDVVEKVYGYLDVAGSPKLPFKFDAKKGAWVFVYPLPVTMQIPKGEFTAKIEAIGKNGEKFTAEKKISTY